MPLWPHRRQADTGTVHRASDTPRAVVQNMSVNHRRAHVILPKQLLDSANDIPVLQEVGGKGIPKRVALRFRGELFEYSAFLKTNKQMNEVRKLIQRSREIEHQRLKR